MNLLSETAMQTRALQKLGRLALVVVCVVLWSGCERFLVSPCVVEPEFAGCSDMLVGTLPDSVASRDFSADGVSNVPNHIGAVRSFQWKTKIDLANQEKFVGFYREDDHSLSAITVSNENAKLRFISRTTNILVPLVGKDCMNCPKFPSNFRINDDLFRLSGNRFWFFDKQSRTFLWYDRSSPHLIKEFQLAVSPAAAVLFFSPDFDALAVTVTPNMMGYYRTIAFFDLTKRADIEENIQRTGFVIGDMDSIDQTDNGREIIRLNGDSVGALEHFWFEAEQRKFISDQDLRDALNNSIGKTKMDNLSNVIDSAFLKDINKDGFVDFIYARNGLVYVSSYMGKISGNIPRFEHWHAPVLSIVEPGEFVKSVLAVDLSDDNLPELVVETNKAVHFYLNTKTP